MTITEKILISMLVLCLLSIDIMNGIDIQKLKSNESKQIKASIEVVEDPGTPFNIKIMDDHEVILTNATDTITLSLENAYELADEYVIYVK